MDLHELVRRRVLRRHVGVADSCQSPVCSLDLVTRGGGGDAEDVVERGRMMRSRDEIRGRGGLVGSAGGGGEGSRGVEADTWQGLGGRRGGEEGSGEDCGGGGRRSREHGLWLCVRSLREESENEGEVFGFIGLIKGVRVFGSGRTS